MVFMKIIKYKILAQSKIEPTTLFSDYYLFNKMAGFINLCSIESCLVMCCNSRLIDGHSLNKTKTGFLDFSQAPPPVTLIA